MRVELTGTRCPLLPGVTVGVQRGSVVVDERPADGGTHRWSVEVDLKDGDIRGPFVHGRRGDRFLYLAWRQGSTGFRRAKLMLAAVPPPVMAAAAQSGLLQGTLPLALADGSPVCAAVRPPAVTWQA